MLIDELQSAVFKNDYNTIERWAHCDEHFNVANFDLTTPLHWVAQSGNFRLAQLLVEHGAPLKKSVKNIKPHVILWIRMVIIAFIMR